MRHDDVDDQLFRLASDDARIYDDARRWFLAQDAAAAPALIAGLDDARIGSVGHWRILLVLRELKLPSTLPAILAAFRTALGRRNPIVLPGALEALAVFDDAEAWSALGSALDSEDPDVVNHAAALLVGKGGKRAEDAIARLIDRADPKLRQSAVNALLKIDSDTARRTLARLRERERDPSVIALLRRLP
jgi:HEAT repeat protein